MSAHLTGGCGCGAVKFELSAPLKGAVYCHCKRCQVRTGTAASATALMEKDSLTILSGEDRLGTWQPEDGFGKDFCRDCGSHLFGSKPDGEIVFVRLGAIDGDPGIRPQARQFVAYAASWEDIPDDGLPRFDEALPSALIVEVSFEERYWYPDDGGIVWLAGYSLVDPDSGSFLARDAPQLIEWGLRVAGVAGAGRHHHEALQSEEAAPGGPLKLRRDPDNEHDPNAIAVDLPAGEQLGWVPRELAEELAPGLDAGETWSAVVLREARDSPRAPRTGVTMLLAATSAVELKITR